MSRCQHCKNLTHSENLYVYVNVKDYDKIEELMCDKDWKSNYMYLKHENPYEIGYLEKCDIKIRFIILPKERFINENIVI